LVQKHKKFCEKVQQYQPKRPYTKSNADSDFEDNDLSRWKEILSPVANYSRINLHKTTKQDFSPSKFSEAVNYDSNDKKSDSGASLKDDEPCGKYFPSKPVFKKLLSSSDEDEGEN